MRKFVVCIVTLAFLIVSSVLPVKADVATVRKELEKINAVVGTSMVNGDMKALFGTMTADATYKEIDGSVLDRAKLEASMKQMLVMMKLKKVTPKIMSIKVTGGTAVTRQSMTSLGILIDEKGKEHKCETTSDDRLTWIKTPKGWRIKEISVVGQSMKVDGKLVPGPGASAPKKLPG